MLEEQFKKTIEKYGLFPKRSSLMLGVSGGPDSVCMLEAFARLKSELKLRLLCVHLNHCLRTSADQDEEFVRDLCKKKNIQLVSQKKAVKKIFKGNSLEQAARQVRMDFFLECSRRHKIKTIALAHNKDDVAETVLMRMIRGSALRGLRAIMPKSKFKNLTLIRPLIATTKEEILTWLNDEGIAYCIDESNLTPVFLRNKIRLDIMPQLEELNPQLKSALTNLALSVGMDYDFIYSFSQKEYNRLKKQKGPHYIKLKLESRFTNDMHPAVVNNILRYAIEEVKGNLNKIELRHLEEILDLIKVRPQGSIVSLPDLEVKKEGGYLTIKSLIL